MAMDVQRSPEVKKRKQRRRIYVATAVMLGLALVTWGLSNLEPAAREVDNAAVWSDTVKRGPFVRSVRGPGTLVPDVIRFIAAETEGQVEEVVIDPGAQVTPDSVILELSNPELEQTVGDAELALLGAEAEYTDLRVQLASQLLTQEAEIARVEAEFKVAKLQAEADRQLNEEGLVPEITRRQSELAAEQLTVRFEKEKERLEKTRESHEAQLAARRSQVQQRRAVYELRRAQLDRLKVRAGIRGVLQAVPVEEGQRVTPGTTLARVAQPDVLKAELRIAETQAKDIQIGQSAEIDTRNGVIPGHVSRIDPAVLQGSVLVDVKLDVEELPRGARPDLSVDGTIELERVDEAVYVGRPAYGQAFSTVGLFKINPDGTANRVQVKLGRLSVQHVEILEGLQVGDRVILSDSSQWDDVDRIRLR
jgi:HlyD family secretion protein